MTKEVTRVIRCAAALLVVLAGLLNAQPCDPAITSPGRALWERLKSLKQQDRFAFGYHDAILYGINSDASNTNWTTRYGENLDRSDLKTLTGRHPMVFGFDLARPDSPWLTFNGLKERVRDAYRAGGIIVFSWHRMTLWFNDAWVEPTLETVQPGGVHHSAFITHLDELAAFFNDLRDDQGDPIPFVFRPYHEYTGWFWWVVQEDWQSRSHFINLFRMTIDHFRNAGCHSFLVALSPCGHRLGKDRDFFFAYPGDDYVDIYAVDQYFVADCDFADQGGALSVDMKDGLLAAQFWNAVNIVAQAVKDKQAAGVEKLMAIAEFGAYQGIWGNPLISAETAGSFYKGQFLDGLTAHVPVENRQLISYAFTWRNGSKTHGWIPVANHPGAEDFAQFANDSRVLLLNDKPVIVELPQSVVCMSGETVVFTVDVSSDLAVSYQWFWSADDIVDPSDSELNEHAAQLVLSPVTALNEGYYYCKISNITGSVISEPAMLCVRRQMARWTFDASDFTGSTYQDSSGNGHHALANRPAGVAGLFVPGAKGDAVLINEDSWAHAGTWQANAYSGEITVSAWVKIGGSLSNLHGVVCKRSADGSAEWALFARDGDVSHPGTNYLRFMSWENGALWSTQDALADGEWVHAAVTVDSEKKAALYINGLLNAQVANWNFGSAFDAPMTIGGMHAGTVLGGQLDEVTIYNYAMDEYEIAELFYGVSGESLCIHPYDAGGDFNNDCIIDIVDLSRFAAGWLSCGLYPHCN